MTITGLLFLATATLEFEDSFSEMAWHNLGKTLAFFDRIPRTETSFTGRNWGARLRYWVSRGNSEDLSWIEEFWGNKEATIILQQKSQSFY